MTRRIMNRLYGRVYGWFDSKEARVITSAVPARFSTRARLALTNLEDRTVPATFVVLNDGDGSAAGSLATQIAALDASTDATNTLDLATNFTTPTILTLTDALPSITVPVTIQGNQIAGVNQLTISGGGALRIFDLGLAPDGTAITIDKVDMTAGFQPTGSQGGGALLVGNQVVTLSNSSITGSTANAGGAIYLYGGTLNINSTTLSGNATNSNFPGGGAIFSFNNATLNITNSTLANNSATPFTPGQATRGGGAIGTVGGAITITGSTLTGNTSLSGGAIGVYNNNTTPQTLTISNSTFSGNQATGGNNTVSENGNVISITEGGGTTTAPFNLNMSNCTVTGNVTGSRYGGMLYINDSNVTSATAGVNVTINHSNISNNIAVAGGVILAFGGTNNVNTYTITNSVLSGNTSTAASGGVIYSRGNQVFNIDNSTLSGNSTARAGGALFGVSNRHDRFHRNHSKCDE